MFLVRLVNKLNRDNPLDLNIIDGEKVLLQGSSGIGKTISVESILNLVDLKNFNIKINENNINKSKKNAYSAQSAWSLGGTLVDEVSLLDNEKVNIKRLTKACYATCISENLDYKNIVNHKWNKTNTKSLSAGELKRLSIARVLYLEPSFLVLDEPTASVQQELKELIIKRIINSFKKATILVISHDKYSDNVFDRKVIWK